MALSRRIEETKEAFLLLTQQYSQLSKYRETEMRALTNRDMELWEAAALNFQVQMQEFGEQLKIVGTCLDSLGGQPVMFPRGPIVEPLPGSPLS